MDIRSITFEYNAIKEILDEEADTMPMAEQLEMQYRMCELIGEIRSMRNKQSKENAEAGFRKTPVKATKKVNETDMTDYRAFKHFLENPENTNKYKKSTLSYWRNSLKNGKLPAAITKILRFAGYTVKTERKWNRPRKKRKK